MAKIIETTAADSVKIHGQDGSLLEIGELYRDGETGFVFKLKELEVKADADGIECRAIDENLWGHDGLKCRHAGEIDDTEMIIGKAAAVLYMSCPGLDHLSARQIVGHMYDAIRRAD